MTAVAVRCRESLVDNGFVHECMRPAHPETEPHASGVEFYSETQGTMHALLLWSRDIKVLPRTDYGLRAD